MRQLFTKALFFGNCYPVDKISFLENLVHYQEDSNIQDINLNHIQGYQQLDYSNTSKCSYLFVIEV